MAPILDSCEMMRSALISTASNSATCENKYSVSLTRGRAVDNM